MTDVKLRIRYPQTMLPLYDGSKSIHGVSRAILISMHAFINNDIKQHATSLRGAQIFMQPSRRGSYLQEILIQIQHNPEAFAAGVSSGVLSNACYDFLKITFAKATGLFAEPDTSYMTKLNTKDEPFLDSVAQAMEGPLIDGHRTIHDHRDKITIERPRSVIAELDRDTLDWVTTSELQHETEVIYGNVTRYNVISQKGRLYDIDLKRTISFEPENDFLSDTDAAVLSWSLDRATNRTTSTIMFHVKRILSARDQTKRYILVGCNYLE